VLSSYFRLNFQKLIESCRLSAQNGYLKLEITEKNGLKLLDPSVAHVEDVVVFICK